MTLPLTPQQRACLDAIQRLTRNDIPPSYVELQRALGLASRSGVHRLLHALKDRGWVDFDYGRCRTIRLLNTEDNLNNLPTDALLRMRRRIDVILQSRAQ